MKRLFAAINLVFFEILSNVYVIADVGDAPGLMLVELGIVSLPAMVYVLLALLESILTPGLQLKTEA